IDDTYSNDLASLQIALDFLRQQQQHKNKTLILSAMEGLDDKLQTQLLGILQQQNLSRLIFVGDTWQDLADILPMPSLVSASPVERLQNLPNISVANESILVTGSRRFHLEDLSTLLVAKSHESVLEMNLRALEHNLAAYRSLLP